MHPLSLHSMLCCTLWKSPRVFRIWSNPFWTRSLRTLILATDVEYTKIDLIQSETPQDFSRDYGKAWNAGSGMHWATLNNFCKCVLLNVSHVPLPINSCNSLTKGLQTHIYIYIKQINMEGGQSCTYLRLTRASSGPLVSIAMTYRDENETKMNILARPLWSGRNINFRFI